MKNVQDNDFHKDIVAMSNSGGGTIVCGITEKNTCATGIRGVGEFPEAHERTLPNADVARPMSFFTPVALPLQAGISKEEVIE